MNAELVTIDGEVAEHRAPMTLFGTDDPQSVVERASTVATALAGVINERHLYTSIGNKKHVQVEGWTLLGSMLGVFAEVEWSRPLDNGWEARAVARTLAGQVVGAAEAMCTTGEGRWRSADPYAVRSMAQTRAVSKALRLPLGFIMQLAGYSATPAEELNDEPGQGVGPSRRARAHADPVPASATEQPQAAEQADSEASTSTATTPPAADLRGELARVAAERHLGIDVIETYATLVGIPKGERATDEQLHLLLQAIQTHGTSEELVLAITQGAGETSSVATDEDSSSAPAEPPKPGTDEYKALPVQEKAKARAHWAVTA